jgi:predicted SAM-dependent methyltransferase
MHAKRWLKENLPRPLFHRLKTAKYSMASAKLRARALFDSGPSHTCPICRYVGPFLDEDQDGVMREEALCPGCLSAERHRLQMLVFNDLLRQHDFSRKTALHFAPERFFEPMFRKACAVYHTADIDPADVDYCEDLRHLSFQDESYDFVWASHVLEHVDQVDTALSEISRILRPGGIAILPVPIVADRTVEYPEAVATENYHVRAPGLDFFERYKKHFSQVHLRTSDDFAATGDTFQIYIYEDRTKFPIWWAPYRPPMQGDRHIDVVPICIK